MSHTVLTRFDHVESELVTRDISLEGLFVSAERPASLNTLVHITASLPSGKTDVETVHLRGQVTRSVPGLAGTRRGGMGIHFYGLGVSARARWLAFFERTQGEVLGSQGPAAPIAPQFKKSAWATRSEDLDDTPSSAAPAPTPVPSPVPALAAPPVLLYAASIERSDLERFMMTCLETNHAEVVLDERHPDRLDLPPLAVLALPHPVSGAELHIPARFEPSKKHGVVSLDLIGVTPRTRSEFRHYIDHAEPPPTAEQSDPAELEKVLYEVPSEVQHDLEVGSSDVIGVMIPQHSQGS